MTSSSSSASSRDPDAAPGPRRGRRRWGGGSACVGGLGPTFECVRLATGADLHLLRRHRRLADLAHADLEQAAVVARVDLVGGDAVGQRELAAERAVPELPDEHLAGLVPLVVAVPPLAADGEASFGHLDVHVALDVN